MIRIQKVSNEESKNFGRFIWPVKKPNFSKSGEKLDENWKPLKGRAKQGYHMEVQFLVASATDNPSKMGNGETLIKVLSFPLKRFAEFIETYFCVEFVCNSKLNSIQKWNEIEKNFLKDEASIDANIFQEAFAAKTEKGIKSLYGLASKDLVVYRCYTTKSQKGKSPCKDKNGIEKRFSVKTGEIKNTMSTPDTSEWVPFWNTTEVKIVGAPSLLFSEIAYNELRKRKIEEDRGFSDEEYSSIQF